MITEGKKPGARTFSRSNTYINAGRDGEAPCLQSWPQREFSMYCRVK
jgi:hypothetical protein